MIPELREAFASIGAQATFETNGRSFEIDVVKHQNHELFRLIYPSVDAVRSEIVELRPKQRQLVLDVRGGRLPLRARYLCGFENDRLVVTQV